MRARPVVPSRGATYAECVTPPADIVALLERVRRQRAARWAKLPVGGASSRLWRGLFPDGSSLILKAGEGADLAREIAVYEGTRGTFLPRLIAADTDMGFLALEDLTDFGRPPPWTPRQIELAVQALDELAIAEVPARLPPARRHVVTDGWRRVEADPAPLLGLFMCTERWLGGALPTLLEAEAAAVVDGGSLVHRNPRACNLLVGSDRATLLDWRHAVVGNPQLDRAMLAGAIHADGGPLPEAIGGHEPALAAAMAGYFASEAGRPDGDPAVRAFQFDQLSVSLPWAARALGLPDPLGGGSCFGGVGRGR